MKDRFKEEWVRVRDLASLKAQVMRQRTRVGAHTLLDASLTLILSPWRAFKFLCFMIGLTVLISVSIAGSYSYRFFDSLPNISQTSYESFMDQANNRVLDRLETKSKKYKWIEIKDINRALVHSIVLSEDSTFFEHGGFNFEAIIDSFAENLKERRAAYGASTISQQVVKNVFLTQEKTLIRKLKEFVLTWQLERHFSKNEILEVYLNIAEFGPDVFGVNAAAHHFYDTAPKFINAPQGAFLAQMLPSPRRRYYAIWKNRNLSRKYRKRIDRVLRDMLYGEFITDDQYRQFIRYRYFDIPSSSSRMPARSR